MSKLQAVGSRIIVTPKQREETTESGIILSQMKEEVPTSGEVFSVGNKVKDIKVGDTVMFEQHGFTYFPYKGEEYFIMYEQSVIAKL